MKNFFKKYRLLIHKSLEKTLSEIDNQRKRGLEDHKKILKLLMIELSGLIARYKEGMNGGRLRRYDKKSFETRYKVAVEFLARDLEEINWKYLKTPVKQNPGYLKFLELMARMVAALEPPQTINSSSFTNNGKPVIVIYWTTTCKPCVKEHNEITKRLAKWQKDTGVRVISITPEKKSKIPVIKEKIRKYGWKHEFYVDNRKRFGHKLLGNWHGVPQTFVFDSHF